MGAIYLHGFVSAGFMSQPPIDDSVKEFDAEQPSVVDEELCLSQSSCDSSCEIHPSQMNHTKHCKENCNNQSNTSMTDINCKYICSHFIGYLRDTFDISFLKHRKFMLFVSSSSLSLCGHLTTYLYLPVIATSNGSLQALLISIIGVFTTVGRVISGVLGDHPLVTSHRNIHYGLPMMITGVATASAAFISKTWGYYMYSVVFGICTGGYLLTKINALVNAIYLIYNGFLSTRGVSLPEALLLNLNLLTCLNIFSPSIGLDTCCFGIFTHLPAKV